MDGINWEEYTKGIKIKDNGVKIYARLKNGMGQVGGVITGTVTNIDRLEPVEVEIAKETVTTNSITVEVIAKDAEATEIDGKSGIAKYYYSSDGGTTWEPEEGDKNNSYTINNLEQNKEYKVKVKVEDEAGNYKISEEKKISTKNIETLTESNTEISYTPKVWTSGKVTIEINTEVTGYILEYSVDGTSWREYSGSFIVQDNGTRIYARLKDNQGNTGGVLTANIENIDRLEPEEVLIKNVEETTNSIKVEGEARDAEATEIDGTSGIAKYYFSKDGGTTWEPTEGQSTNIYTFNNLEQEKEYKIKIKAEDGAKNSRESEVRNTTTGRVTGLTENNSNIIYTPSGWTNERVTVQINTDIKGYTLEYSTDGTNWQDYEGSFTVEDNGMKIYARLKDTSGQVGGVLTGNINNIDRLAPTIKSVTTSEITTNSVKITAEAEEAEATNIDGKSGIKCYYFSSDGGTTWTEGTTNTYTFSNLNQNVEYVFVAKVEDRAGNISDIKSTPPVTTGTVTDLTTSNTTFSYEPSTWTNGNVKVGITTTVTGYTLQYSTDGSTWNNYTAKIDVTENGKIYARLRDNAGNTGGVATGNVANIDKTVPTISTVLNATETTTSSINLSIGVTDADSGLSTIEWYYKLSTATTYTKLTDTYTVKNGVNAGVTTAITKTKSITGLKTGTYNIYAKVYDVAGNSKQSSTINVTTGTVTGLTTSNTTFSYEPSTWTNGKVKVGITTTVTGYTLQYSTDGSTWNNYTAKIELSANGKIYARLKDSAGNVGEVATGNVTKIDKTAPTISKALSSPSKTTSSINVSIGVTDQNSGLSTIEWYYKLSTASTYTKLTNTYTTKNGTTAGTTTATTKTRTISNLDVGQYDVYAIVYDVAGNSKQSSTITVPTLPEGIDPSSPVVYDQVFTQNIGCPDRCWFKGAIYKCTICQNTCMYVIEVGTSTTHTPKLHSWYKGICTHVKTIN